MTATMTTAAGILKEVYEGSVRDQLTEEQITSKRIQRSKESIFETPGGKYVVFPVRKNRNHGISYRAENTAIAAARRQGYAQAQEVLKYGYGRLRITGQLMELAESNAEAFMDGATAEIDNLKQDVLVDQNRIMIGNRVAYAAHGFTGVLARVTANSTLTTITVDSTDWVEQDMLIDITDNTGAAVAGGSGRVVTAVTSATTFTVDSNVAGTVIGNNVNRSGNFGQEPYGLLNLVGATGTVHNINSGTAGNEWWKSTVDSTTTTLTEIGMVSMCDQIRRKSGHAPTAIFCSLGCRRSYFNLLTSMRRYNEPKNWEGGLIGLAFNYGKEIPVVEDPMFPANTMLYLDEKEVSIYRPKDWYFADTDGDMFKWVTDYDAWEALLKQYWQMVIHNRRSAGLQTAIVEAA